MRLLPALQVDCPKRDGLFPGGFFQDGDIFGIEGALTGIIQDAALFFNMGVLCTLPESGQLPTLRKGQMPQPDSIVRFVTAPESLVLQEFGVGQKRLLFRRRQDAQSPFSLALAVLNAGIQQVG